MKLWHLVMYDVLRNIYSSIEEGKNTGSPISLDEPTPTPKDKCYVIVTQVDNHYEVTISKTINPSAVRCEECVNRRHAEHLAELAQIMYRSNKF